MNAENDLPDLPAPATIALTSEELESPDSEVQPNQQLSLVATRISLLGKLIIPPSIST